MCTISIAMMNGSCLCQES